MTDKEFNSSMIRSCEARIKIWKELLAAPYKNKDVQYSDWYLDYMRDFKNFEEIRLKKLVIDQTNL